MSPAEIYAVAVAAGFPPVVAVTMTAIALRESSGNPRVLNDCAATGDMSYGLWQINLRSPAVLAVVKTVLPIVEQAPEALLDPVNNARAAAALWNRNNRNLATCWYIDREPYKSRYQIHLPAAQAAALGA